MPATDKPIVFVCGSRSIDYLNLDLYIDKDSIGQVISGEANGVDTLVEKWAKKNKIDFLAFLPQYDIYGGKYAPIKRDEDMVNHCDYVIAFWDGKSRGVEYTIEYAAKMGHRVYLHRIEDLDVM